jgi:transcriptional regulator with XRE-family HTH domain
MAEFINERIGARVREFRRRKHITQEALAERTDLSATFIGSIEAGRKGVSTLTLTKIATALGITASTLLLDEQLKDSDALGLEATELFADCSAFETRLLLDILAEVKRSLRANSGMNGTV